MLPCSGLKPAVYPAADGSCWSKPPQRDPTHFPCPSISARMRKRRAFADKELENVMLQRELRQRELQNDVPFPASALVPVIAPSPLHISPGLHCCAPTKDPSSAGTAGCVPIYKYKPLYECGLQFYEFFYLKSRSSTTRGDYNDFLSCQSSEQHGEEKEDGWKDCGKKIPAPPRQRLRNARSPSQLTEIMDSDGSSTTAIAISGSGQGVPSEPDVSRTLDPRPLTAKGWQADAPSTQAGPRADSVKSPHGGSARIPAVKPLPFSVEALLRA